VLSRFVVCPIHIGREQELQALTQHASGLAQSGRTLFVAGDAGVGKTRLASEAMRMATERGYLVLSGQCLEGATAAYAPVVAALRRHSRRLDSEQLRAWFDGPARLAAALLPEIAADVGQVGGGAGLAPEDLDAAVWQVLARAARQQPLLLLVEDLHWAGPDTLRLLTTLIREVADVALWIVATYRTDELHRRHPLTATLTTLARERRYEEIRLEPLDREALRLMLSAIFDGTGVGDEFLDAVMERSGGNPFFVEELCKVLVESGDIYHSGGDWNRRDLVDIELPLTIRDTLDARLRNLPSETVAALRVGAIAGENVEPTLLQMACGLDAAATRQVIAAGLEHQLLVERRDGTVRQYAYRHSLTRELLVHDLIGAEKENAHRGVAEALLRIHADDLDSVAAELADHLAEAGDTERALDLARRAARVAIRLHAPDEAVARYQQALRLMPRRDPGRLELLIEAAEATVHAADRRVATSLATEARQLATAAGDVVTAARAIRVLAQDRWWSGDGDGALELSREVMHLVTGRGDRWELWALSHAIRRYALLDLDEQARMLMPRALEMARDLDELVELSRLQTTCALIGGDGIDVVTAFEAALAAAQQSGDELQQVTVLSDGGYIALWRGNLEQAARRFAGAMDLGQRVHLRFAAHAGVGLAWARALSGEFDEALGLVEQHKRSSDLPNHLDALTAAGEVYSRRGMEPALRACAEEHWRLARPTKESQTMVPALASLARARLADGFDAAAPVFGDALERVVARGSARLLHFLFTPDMAQALFATGDAAGLQRVTEAASSATDGVSAHRHNMAALRFCQGLHALSTGRHDEAEAQLAESLGLYRQVPCPARIVEVLLAMSDLAVARDGDVAAVDSAREAQEIAQRLNMPSLGARASAALRRGGVRVSGVRPSTRTRGTSGGLSEREREVAMLVARGLSNAEIATRLYLSERTARNHVSNILAKLELRRRADVARWATEQSLLQPVGDGGRGEHV
jgi:DNA-binding CsgD family transcriptional regulator/tetratricopeptide (TPR) repeat protein